MGCSNSCVCEQAHAVVKQRCLNFQGPMTVCESIEKNSPTLVCSQNDEIWQHLNWTLGFFFFWKEMDGKIDQLISSQHHHLLTIHVLPLTASGYGQQILQNWGSSDHFQWSVRALTLWWFVLHYKPVWFFTMMLVINQRAQQRGAICVTHFSEYWKRQRLVSHGGVLEW